MSRLPHNLRKFHQGWLGRGKVGVWLEVKWAVGGVPQLPEGGSALAFLLHSVIGCEQLWESGPHGGHGEGFQNTTSDAQSVVHSVVGGLLMPTHHELGTTLFL